MPQAVIPIHTSDRALFKMCRRKWNWASPMRHRLTPKVSVSGVNFNLAFGTAVHTALEHYYTPDESGNHGNADPIDVFIRAWTALADEVAQVNPDFYTFNIDEFDRYMDLGSAMMRNYVEYANQNDNFRVIETEHDFSVALGVNAWDSRTGTELPVHYRGRMDAIVQDLDSGRFGIIDHKTAARPDEDYFIKLEMDEQCTSYMCSAEQEALQQDLPYKRIDFVIYNVLHKKAPAPPTLTKNGFLSINRQTQTCTAEQFLSAVEENGLQEWFADDVRARDYYDWLQTVGNDRFIQRAIVTRNRHEITNQWQRIKWEVEDMLRPNLHIYPSPSGAWHCIHCQFRGPCLAANDGSDYESMLEENYEQNRHYEPGIREPV